MNSVHRYSISVAFGLLLGITVGSLLYFVFSWERHRSPQLENTPQQSSQFVEAENNPEEGQQSQTLSSDWAWSEGIQSKNLNSVSTMVANADRIELQAMISQVFTRPWTPRILVIKKLLLGKLAQFAPYEALDRVWKSSIHDILELVDVVFREWSVQNLQDALTSASNLSQPYRDVAFTAIVSEHGGLTLTSAGQFELSDRLKSFLVKWEAEVAILELIQRPTKAALLLLNDDIPDREQITLLERIVDAWQPHMGLEILNILLDQLYSTDSLLSKELVARVLTADPAAAMDHVTSGKQVKHPAMLGRLLVRQYWSEIGAIQTMDAAQNLEDLGLGNVYNFDFFDAWGAGDPLGVLNQFEQVPRNWRPYAIGRALRKLAEIDVNGARQRFESLKSVPGAISEFAESELVRGWAVSDPASAFKWLLENSKERSVKRSFLMPFILSEYAKVDSERASELAEEHGLPPPN